MKKQMMKWEKIFSSIHEDSGLLYLSNFDKFSRLVGRGKLAWHFNKPFAKRDKKETNKHEKNLTSLIHLVNIH